VAEIVKLGVEQNRAKAAVYRGPSHGTRISAIHRVVDADLFTIELGKDGLKASASHPPRSPRTIRLQPDGKKVAYLQGNDLYGVISPPEKRPGSRRAVPKRCSWTPGLVYQEEIYGRGTFRAFWWSPDSQRIAYLSLDESKVPGLHAGGRPAQPRKC